MANIPSHICQVSGKTLPSTEMLPINALRDTVLNLLLHDYPNINAAGYIAKETANIYRFKHVEQLLQDENGDMNRLDKEVIAKIRAANVLSRNIEPELDQTNTFGKRVADHIASFGGSWTFILLFLGFIFIWVLINVFLLTTGAFDPYPFILLNLLLSCVAALQAPVIMMSQNRQEAKDRLRSEHDYQINLKAELEIQQLNEKVDHLMLKQGQRLLEIQEVQVELMKQILEQLPRGSNI